MKPFRVKVRVQNNRLVRAREELGLTQVEAARRMRLSKERLNSLENFRDPAWGPFGWTPSALRIAEFYGYSPEYLWPEEIAMVKRNAFVLEANATEAFALSGGEVDETDMRALTHQLDSAMTRAPLSARERGVLQLRSAGLCLDDAGAKLGGISRERVRQLELRAHRKIRDRITLDDIEEKKAGYLARYGNPR